MNLKDIQKRVGDNVKKYRKKAGWSQESMRDKGVNFRYYQKIEAGKVNLTLDLLVRLAKIFDCDPRDLLK
jgi:transcriptional regulator with XRE-family HTH domain